ncbi:MAG: 2-oxoacid:ferredoxin oxidoreductase subunit beta [Dehalococcoidia bacterium]
MITGIDPKVYDTTVEITWCPGCGDFAILKALKAALAELEIAPHQVLLVSGIGCGSKLPDYINANGYMTIHGRPLAVATGAKLANPDLHVIVVNGDGDSYGIGGNHFVHTCRRNPNITQIVENNQIYGLTKGQYSPTSDVGFVTTTSPDGVIEAAFNPAVIALAAGATFIARAFSGDPKHMAGVIAQGVRHRGYALIDVLQPCVTFNRLNTYAWYRERVYDLEAEGYDPSDRTAAWQKAQEWGERIPLGVIYRVEGVPTYEDRVKALEGGSPVSRLLSLAKAPPLERYEALKKQFV